MAYNGSVELISGIKQANNGTFPLVDASAVRVSDDKRLDAVVSEVAGKAERTNTVLETTLSRGRKSGTTAGVASFAFGTNVEASGNESHAEGKGTTASGPHTHVEGYNTTASGEGAHAEGSNATAIGAFSHAEGAYTRANSTLLHVFGKSNAEDPSGDEVAEGEFVEIVGNGSSDGRVRSNARALDWEGNEYLMSDLYIRSEMDSTGGKRVAAENMIATANDSSTATKNYPVGSLLIKGGDYGGDHGSKLYKVTAAISIGDSITEGTNVTETTLADELSAIWAALQQS